MDEKSEYDLFNNPMVNAAKSAMTKEQIQDYKKMGEYMYSTNFQAVESKSLDKPPDTEDILSYAVEGLKAGLHPSELSETELQALNKIYGQTWYEKYGWEAEDVPRPMIEAISEAEHKKDQELAELERNIRETVKKNQPVVYNPSGKSKPIRKRKQSKRK